MANPVAAFTFGGFLRIYTTVRDLAPPGGGTWATVVKIFDTASNPTFPTGQTFSAGSLVAADPNGITVQSGSHGLAFLGDGLPTVPIYVAAAGLGGAPNSSDYWDTCQGAWSFGSELYLAVARGGILYILKSTNAGATWAIQDAANGPTGLPSFGTQAAIQRVNDLLCVFVADGTDFSIWEFDLTVATNQWSASFGLLSIPNFSDFGLRSWSNGLFKFPNGDYIAIYDIDTFPGPQLVVVRQFTAAGATWGSNLVLPGLRYANSVIDPSFNTVHILTYQTTGQTSPVHYSTFTHASSSLTTDIAIIPATVSASDGVGHCSIQNNILFVPRDDENDFNNAVWAATVPVAGNFFKELLPIPAGEGGIISGVGLNGSGTGYAVNDTGTISVGTSGTYKVTAIQNNGIASSSSNSLIAGTGYAVGDVGTVNGGTTPAQYIITKITTGGAVFAYALTALGAGYSVANNVGTTATSGAGTGFQINILALFNGVVGLTVTNPGTNYPIANGVATATGGAQPGVGTGLTIDILSVTGAIPSCAYMMFPNGYQILILAIACPVSPLTATVGVLYTSDAPIVTGGTAPFTFTLLSGPPWLTINPATGAVSGTPPFVGAFTYTIQVTDSLGATATVVAPCPLTVGAPHPPPPPPFCIINPAPGTNPTVVVYDEPTELQGS